MNAMPPISKETYAAAAKVARKAVDSLLAKGMSYDALRMAEKAKRYEELAK